MFPKVTRREFIKTAAMSALAFSAFGVLPDEKVFAASDCAVKTRYGTFRGFLDQNGVKTWLGIPYAQPPVGKMRWRAPEPLKPSNKTFDAKKFGFTAMQTIDENEAASTNPQSEDCLTLNIWARGEGKNKPVMVFIHGGGFQTGGTSDPLYCGSNFAAANDVVIVTLNYRVSVFGFVNFASFDPSFEDSGYDPITEPVVLSLPFPLEQGSNTENASVIIYGFVCPGLRNDLEQELVINTMTDLFADGASGLQQSFRDALPYGTLESHIVTMGPEDAVTFIAKNVNPEDAEVFREIVDKAIADVAENGFPADQVDAVMASLETSALLTRESGDLVEDKILPIIEYKVYSGDPWNYLDYQDGLFQMDKWNAQGLYKKAVCDWLADSRTTALVTTWPEPGSREIKDAESAEKLAAVKEGMTEEEIAEIVASSNAAPETEDTSDMVAGLQAVTVESLPEDWKLYEVSDETGEDGIRHIDAAANIEDIGKVNLLLDTSGFGREDIHWLTLYTDLLTALETDSHSKGDLAGMISRYLYNYRILASAWQDGKDGVHPWLQLSWISMDDDLEEGYDLMREILFGTRFDDPVKILEQVRAIRAGMKSDIADDPEELMLNRAFARDSQRMRYNSFAQGLEYYEFLGRTQKQLQDEPEAVTTKLKEIQSRLDNRTNAVAMFAGNENSIALNRQLADSFLASLDARKIEQAEYDLPLPEMNEALVIDSSVQYNMLSASYRALGQNGHEGGMDVLAGLVTDVILTPLLRDQYGVYSPNCTVYISDDGGMFIYTYRDPNIAETFRVLDDLPEIIAGSGIDQETLDGYILKSYAYYAMPQGELSGAVNAAEAVLKGRPQDESVTSMRQLKQLNLEKLADYTGLLEKFSEAGAVRTAGGAAAINAEADRYDKILNPF